MTTKIIDPDLLVVGTELTINTDTLTYTLNQAGNLGPEGVSLQALYSKFKELWLTSTYQPFPFPMYSIDAEAGKYQVGTDGATFSGWKPANDTTRTLQRDGGWEEYLATGALARVYAGIQTPAGSVLTTEQLYYQRATAGVARNFTFLGPVNEGIQVFGDATNGAFDERAYFKVFARTQGRTYSEKTLADGGYVASGPRLLSFFVSTAADTKVTHSDATADAYGVTVTYFGADQNRAIPAGGTSYPFRTVINGNNKTAEQIYEAVQSMLRKATDMDAGAGTVVGQTATALLSFTGDTLTTATGVYIDGFNTNDTNRIVFTDKNAVPRTFPFVSAGTLVFNSNLVNDANATFRMFFKVNPLGDYGTSTAVTVQNSAGVDITGNVGGVAEIPFDFAYDSNVQGGRVAAADAVVVVVAIGKSSGKFVVAEYTIGRSVGQRITLVAEKERSYLNP